MELAWQASELAVEPRGSQTWARLFVGAVGKVVFGGLESLHVGDERLVFEDHAFAVADHVGEAFPLGPQQQRSVLAALDQFLGACDPRLSDGDPCACRDHADIRAAAAPRLDRKRQDLGLIWRACLV